MNLLKSLATISLITLLSRIFGFMRDAVIARTFGIGMDTDAFFVAFKIPNLLRRIFAEGAFSQAFVPILAEYKNKHGKKAARTLFTYVFGLLTLILLIIVIVGIFNASWLIIITAPGFVNTFDKLQLTNSLLHIMFPYIFLISLSSLMSAVLNTWNYFSVPAFTPILLNISMVIFALFISPYFHPRIIGLAWSVIVGGILQLGCQLPFLKKIGMLVLPKISFKNIGVCRIISRMVPAILSVSINHVSLIVNTIFASFLTSGSISWLYYADRLMEFPSGILGVSLGTILLPSLSKSFSNKNSEEYSSLMDWGLRLCFLLALPSAVAIGILAGPLTKVLFECDKFTALDALMTQHALIAYSVGLIGFILIKVLIPGFYSCQDLKTPIQIAIITLIITQIMNLLFIGPLKHAGLSLSISLASCVNAGLLYWKLRKKNIFKPQPGWLIFFIKLIISVLIMAIVLFSIVLIIPNWKQGTMFWQLSRLTLVCLVGGISYLLMLIIFGFRLKDFIKISLT